MVGFKEGERKSQVWRTGEWLPEEKLDAASEKNSRRLNSKLFLFRHFSDIGILKKKFKLKLKEKEASILFHHDQCIRTTIKKKS